MILQTGQRTDIPAFYSTWFANRLKAGFVRVRNPFHPQAVTEYRLSPDVVDVIGFCSKNPSPMFPHWDLLEPYGQYWFMTITPYGTDLEPKVPDVRTAVKTFQELSNRVGPERIGWRYDPILIYGNYTPSFHLAAFERLSRLLEGYTDTAVISFIDMYPKVVRNFPGVHAVPREVRLQLGEAMADRAREHGMTLKPCGEGTELARFGADCSGCMTMAVYEKGAGCALKPPKGLKGARDACACYLSCDIGAYNSCAHLCRYCYANNDRRLVIENSCRHDPESPFLIGNYEDGDKIHDVLQKSWIDMQMRLPLSTYKS